MYKYIAKREEKTLTVLLTATKWQKPGVNCRQFVDGHRIVNLQKILESIEKPFK